MVAPIEIKDLKRGRVLDDGARVCFEFDSENGQLDLNFSRAALSKLPIYALNLLARAEKQSSGASYYSFPTLEARIGCDQSGTVLIYLALPGSTERLAFEVPVEGIAQLKRDAAAIENRGSSQRGH